MRALFADLLGDGGLISPYGTTLGKTLQPLRGREASDDYAGDTTTTGVVNFGKAASVLSPDPNGGTLSSPGDVDWFRFEATAEEYIQIVASTSTFWDMVLTFHDAQGNLLQEEGRDWFHEPFFDVPEDGVYFVGVSGFNDTVGDYEFEAFRTVDDIAGDASTTQALIPGAAPIRAGIDFPRDNDWFTLRLDNAGDVTFVLDSDGPGITLLTVDIYDANGALMATSPNGSFDMEWTHGLAAGDYFVGFRSGLTQDTGKYFINATFNGSQDVPGDASTTEVVPLDGSNLEVEIDTETDSDWYRLSLDTPGDLTVTLDPTSQIAAEISVIDANGERVGSFSLEDIEGARTASLFLDAGDYFLAFYAPITFDTGRVVVQVSFVESEGDPEAGNSSTTAVLSDDGTPLAATFESQPDTDWFRLDVEADGYYRVTLDNLSQDSNIQSNNLSVVDADGNALPIDLNLRQFGRDGESLVLTFRALESGAVFIAADNAGFAFNEIGYDIAAERVDAGYLPGYTTLADFDASAFRAEMLANGTIVVSVQYADDDSDYVLIDASGRVLSRLALAPGEFASDPQSFGEGWAQTVSLDGASRLDIFAADGTLTQSLPLTEVVGALDLPDGFVNDAIPLGDGAFVIDYRVTLTYDDAGTPQGGERILLRYDLATGAAEVVLNMAEEVDAPAATGLRFLQRMEDGTLSLVFETPDDNPDPNAFTYELLTYSVALDGTVVRTGTIPTGELYSSSSVLQLQNGNIAVFGNVSSEPFTFEGQLDIYAPDGTLLQSGPLDDLLGSGSFDAGVFGWALEDGGFLVQSESEAGTVLIRFDAAGTRIGEPVLVGESASLPGLFELGDGRLLALVENRIINDASPTLLVLEDASVPVSIGSDAGDTMIASPTGSTLFGEAGADLLLGALGDDVLVGDAAVALGEAEGVVYRAYQAALGRAPDAVGFELFAREIRLGNQDSLSIITEMVNSAEFQATYGELTDRGFVELLYTNVFEREGDAAGVAFWTAEIEAGRLSRAEVVTEFANSTEFIQLSTLSSAGYAVNSAVDPLQATVFRLYQAVFDRAPDEAGFELFTAAISLNILTLQDVTAEFVASPEFQDTYGELGNRAFMELLYQNVFEREGDEAGLTAFTAALDAGDLTRADVVAEFVQSYEFIYAQQAAARAFVQTVQTDADDVLDGGAGDDVMFGGLGADSFVLSEGEDVILDFQIGIDRLDLSAFSDFDSAADLQAAATQVGRDVHLDLGDGHLTVLRNVDLDDLFAGELIA